MQKSNAKAEKFLYLALLAPSSSSDGSGRVNLIPSRIGSRRVENMLNSTWVGLKMWATQLRIGSDPKCQPETRPDGQSKLKNNRVKCTTKQGKIVAK